MIVFKGDNFWQEGCFGTTPAMLRPSSWLCIQEFTLAELGGTISGAGDQTQGSLMQGKCPPCLLYYFCSPGMAMFGGSVEYQTEAKEVEMTLVLEPDTQVHVPALAIFSSPNDLEHPCLARLSFSPKRPAAPPPHPEHPLVKRKSHFELLLFCHSRLGGLARAVFGGSRICGSVYLLGGMLCVALFSA